MNDKKFSFGFVALILVAIIVALASLSIPQPEAKSDQLSNRGINAALPVNSQADDSATSASVDPAIANAFSPTAPGMAQVSSTTAAATAASPSSGSTSAPGSAVRSTVLPAPTASAGSSSTSGTGSSTGGVANGAAASGSSIGIYRTPAEILAGKDLSDPVQRAIAASEMADAEEARYEAVLARAKELSIPVRIDGPGNRVQILHDIRGTEPLYRTTLNANAAISTGANLIRQTAPYNLSGSGLKVGVWDGGSVRNTHQEFGTSRVVKRNSFVANDDHATHVAGTIGASGVQASAKGMAPLVSIDSYDWNSDYAEMTAAGAASATSPVTNIPISNHSYGYNATNSDLGRYDAECNTTDNLANSLPFYLIFWAAGNEQQDYGKPYGGYQSITFNGLSKNVVTVGAANDAVTSGQRDVSKGTLATFSSMGPCDDGRIKPDIVANGVSVNSPVAISDTSYDGTYSGTSMATPNAAGSAALLQQLYKTNFSGQLMRASMLKALIIHTADDVGRPGPDYQYGWGYMNAKAAADLILAHKASLAAPKMIDDSVSNASKTKSYSYVWDGTSALRATLCWTDPAGAAQTAADSRTPNLVHNLDLKITAPDGTTVHQPYTMPFVGSWTTNSMVLNATKGKNNVDNVERVDVPNPGQPGTYVVTVSVDGNLTTGDQFYSLVVTGGANVEANPPPVVAITAPVDGAAVLPNTPVTITANATDMAVGGQPGQVTNVVFFEGTNQIGQVNAPPYQTSWTPATSGVRVLTARATDNEGASTVSSTVNVTVLVGDGKPTITSFTPSGGVAGDPVVISGNNLGIASGVRFGALTSSFTVNSSSQLTATVPSAAVTAPITVSNSYGTATTATNFNILPILFREDFLSATNGNTTSPSGSSTAWTGNSNFPTGTNDYQAGGALRLGTGSAIGSITSRPINLSGNGGAFTVGFKVKGWTTREGDIRVTAGTQTQTVTYAATMSGEFETKSLNFTGGTSATTIKIETTAKRAFIDDVTVTSEAPSSPPVITSPSTAGGIAGQSFSYQIAASNSPTSFGATGLPAWASINTTSGVISGATPVAGTNVVSISASNTVGVGSTNLTITILPSGGGGGVTNTIFSENMGVPTNTTSIAGNTFQNSGILSYAGTGDVRANQISSGYVGASGGGNVFINTTTNLFFEISGINTANYTGLALSLGHYKSTTASSNELAIEVSSDGITYSPLTYSRSSGSGTAVWALINPAGNIPSAANLRIRFRQTATNVQFRIDDVKLTGVAPAPSPSISAAGSLSPVSTIYGTASTNPTSFTLSGSNLATGITVAPPAGFEVSAVNTNGFAGQGNSIIVGSGGTVSNTMVFVRLAADTDVGTYSGNIVCSSVGASNATVATVSSTVSAKTITVTADFIAKNYGSEDPELTYSSSETAPFSGALVRDSGENVGSYRIRQGTLSAGSNYAIAFTENNFEISRKSLFITANDVTKQLGQTLSFGAGQTGFSASGLVNGETVGSVTITASGGTAAEDPAGTYTLTPSAATGGTFTPSNYSIIYNAGTLTVTGAGDPNFDDWAADKGLSGPNAAANADPDNDGLANLMEYYMGLEPLTPDKNMVSMGWNPGNPSSLSMTYRRAKGTTGVTGGVVWNSLLHSNNWSASGVITTTNNEIPPESSYEELTSSVTNAPSEAAKFLRLKVTQP